MYMLQSMQNYADRVPEIVGLPPSFASFRIISSKSVCSTNKLSAKKGIFGTKTLILALLGPFQALCGPFLTLFNEKTPFLALVVEIFPSISS